MVKLKQKVRAGHTDLNLILRFTDKYIITEMRINLKMKKIVTLSLSLLLLTACSNETKQVSKQNSSSTTITSEKKDISDSKKLIAQVVSHQLYIIQVHKQMKQLKWN